VCNEISIYIHIPFCLKRCLYCDFNTYAGLYKYIPAYVNALVKEIETSTYPDDYIFRVKSIYFGGGTPSLLSAEQVSTILDSIRKKYQIKPQVEISIEVNPKTVTAKKLHGYYAQGINRISIGVQSIHENELRILGRIHLYEDSINTWLLARKAQFSNVSFDLMFGIPQQNMEKWEQTLQTTISLHPEHLSIYSLIVEPGTPLNQWVNKGIVDLPSDDLAADLYEFTQEYLANFGYYQYEISNWARPMQNGKTSECIHNKQYWKNKPYIGYGAGAHGFFDKIRTENIKHPLTYIKKITEQTSKHFIFSPAIAKVTKLDRITEMRETMMMGLRLTKEGINNQDFFKRFGKRIETVFLDEINELINLNLIEWANNGKTLRLTKRGILLGNQVFMKFI